MKPTINNVTSLANTQYLSLYDATYHNKEGEEKHWMIATRKKEVDVQQFYKGQVEDKIDAVMIVAYHQTRQKLVVIKQFRVPINGYVYELPAGLLDKVESLEATVARELKEETGLDLVAIKETQSLSKVYLSPGMTDESVALLYCLCDGEISKAYLEPDEDIETLLLSREEALQLLREPDSKIDIKASIILQSFGLVGAELFGE